PTCSRPVGAKIQPSIVNSQRPASTVLASTLARSRPAAIAGEAGLCASPGLAARTNRPVNSPHHARALGLISMGSSSPHVRPTAHGSPPRGPWVDHARSKTAIRARYAVGSSSPDETTIAHFGPLGQHDSLLSSTKAGAPLTRRPIPFIFIARGS